MIYVKKPPNMVDLTCYLTSTGALRFSGRPWSAWEHNNGLGPAYRVALSGTVPAPIHVRTELDAIDVLDAIDGATTLALDSEFDSQNGDRLETWQLSDGKIRVLVEREATKPFEKILADPKVRKVFHHFAADAHVFAQAGFEIQGFAADTVILDFLVDENRRRHGLKECADEWLGISMVPYEDAFGIIPPGKKRAVVPPIGEIRRLQPERFLEYATLDPYATYWLYRHHKTILKRLPSTGGKTLWDYYVKYERQFTQTLINIMRRGIAIDVPVLREIRSELTKTISRSSHVFACYAPQISVTRKRGGKEYAELVDPDKINVKSVHQLRSLFYGALGYKSSNPGSTNAEVLRAWADEGKVLPSCVLDVRRASTMRGTFIGEKGKKGLLARVVEEDGLFGRYSLVRTDLNQIGAVTMRLSSRNPNLQNIPARQEKDPYRIRRAFAARQGCRLIVADYNQYELRIMAHFSQDPVMLKAFREHRDLHSTTAKHLFGLKCSVEEVKAKYPDERNKSKAILFALQYGAQAGLIAKQIGSTLRQAQRHIDNYFALYNGVYAWMRNTVRKAKVSGVVRTILGRPRRLLDLNSSDPALAQHARNSALNAPIQGSVADIIKIAMNRLDSDPWMRDHEAIIILQVHDELIVEAPEIDAHVVKNYVVRTMTEAYPLNGVDTVVDGAVGVNWEIAKSGA